MESTEERQLKKITEEFTRGIEFFRKRECQEALDIFEQIVEEYKDSQFFSVIEIQSRSKYYQKICDARLHPVILELEDDEDYLFDGIFHLNAGKPDTALERFHYLEEKKYADPYLPYLISLAYMNKGDRAASMKYLKTVVHADKAFKIIAYNEPDFEPLFDDDEFKSVVAL